MWNALDLDTRHSPSLSAFKRTLQHKFKGPDVPSYFVCGDRRLSVYHARIRNSCSNLNSDLFYNHIRDSPLCSHFNTEQDAEHYFLNSFLLTVQRQRLFQNTIQYHPLSTYELLFGSSNHSDDDNIAIFTEVHHYIKYTNRFQNTPQQAQGANQ